MVAVTRTLLAAMLALAVATATACGGAGNDGGGQATGDIRLTNPASVPSSTPISTELVYQIRDNGISAPTGATATTAAGGTGGGSGAGSYTVQSGDTCGAIATSLGISAQDLIDANPTINAGCTNLDIGDILSVPGGSTDGGGGGSATPTPAPSGDTYTIASGDTCFDIAAAYGVDVDTLVALNNIDCNALQPGDVLRIP